VPSIKACIAVAREDGIDQNIRFHHKVLGASRSSAKRQWLARLMRADTPKTALQTRIEVDDLGYGSERERQGSLSGA
jgi:cation diffusion facilitator CzcD-associated flavoprotein CzcO